MNNCQDASRNCACENNQDQVDFPPDAVLSPLIPDPEKVRQRRTQPVDDVRFSHKQGNRRSRLAWPVRLVQLGVSKAHDQQ